MTDTTFEKLVEAWDSMGTVTDAQRLPAFVATMRNKAVPASLRLLSKAAVESIARTADRLHRAYPAVYCTECQARGRVMTVRVGLFRRLSLVVCRECGRSGTLLDGVDTIAGLIGGGDTPVFANGTVEIPLWNETDQHARYWAIDKLIIREGGVSNYDRAIAALVNAMTADVTRSVRQLRQISVETEGVYLSPGAIRMLENTFGDVSEVAQCAPITEVDAFGPEEGVQPLVVSRQIDPAKAELIHRLFDAADTNGDAINLLFQDDCQGPWVELYHLAAELGHDEAISQICSSTEAVASYRRAAQQEHAAAQCDLGLMYESGRGVEQSNRKAVAWYRRAAEQGHAEAQFNLGLMYESGRGVGMSLHKAVQWYRKAALQGHLSAIDCLTRLDRS